MPLKMPTRMLALLVTLVLATSALAEDACLGGASLLADQRAIDTLRADTESACPCASYTGGAGQDRKAYQSCAKNVQKTALAAGEFRRKCKSYTTQINKGAVCGSELVTCGVFDADTKKAITCKVKKPGACEGKHGAIATACADETHCRDVIDWTAATCLDTRDDGPFAAGVRVITFTKQSAVDPDQTRTLTTTIWYPAPPGSAPLDPAYAAVLNAPLDMTTLPRPLVMFSHGSCGYPQQSTFLTAFLATHGFIVVAPPHPGNTISDFPSCASPSAQAMSAAERPQDISFVIDQMLAANQDSGSPFFGAIDETRIGMSGHSFGGFTTYFVAREDPRVKVAVPMAPASPGIALTVPSLTMLGQIDGVVNVPAIRDEYETAAPPKYLVEIKSTGHYAFSNGCFPSADCNPPVTLTQPEAHLQVRRWVLPFLKVYLAGDASFIPLLSPPAPPHVLLERQL